MSFLSSGSGKSGGCFGTRRNEALNSLPWDPYEARERHGSALARGPPSPPPADFMAFPSDPSPILNAHIEWKETPEAHVYKAHLPGYERNDVRVEVDDDRVLCIVCGKSVEKEEQRGGWHRVELSSGHFVQRLHLPDNSMVDHVKAHMDNGVLTINVPKYKDRPVNNRVRNINISSRP